METCVVVFFIGFAPGNQMNLGTSIAVYASLCKRLGIPFRFPGTPTGYDIFLDATDSDLLAEHLIWEATNPHASNQPFNVVNGDIFRLENNLKLKVLNFWARLISGKK